MIKRIFAISNHGSMLGGGEHSFLGLLSHLPDAWKSLALVPHEGELKARLRENGIETQVIPLPPIRPWFIYNILACLRRYFITCQEYRPDLIYANGSRAAFYGGLVGKLSKLPVIWHCRIADRDPYLDFFLTRLSASIVVNSKATANRFRIPFRSKVRIVYNGIDINWFQSENVRKPDLIQEDWKVILKVARVSRWKRHDLAISAFEEIAMLDPKVHLVCVGAKDRLEPEWWNSLQERTGKSPFSNRIHWIGHVDDVRPWYRAASILVLASTNEPFGRVLVEAMACGVPVVATRSGGVPEIVRHGQDGFLFAPGNAEEMANAMEKILKDENLRERFSRFAQRYVKLFSLNSHVEKMSEIFADTIRN